MFDAWMQKTAHPHVFFAGDVPLYPLLNASDTVATYTSTVGCEALLMRRPVIQLKYYPGVRNMFLGEWGFARLAETPQDLPELVRQSFYHTGGLEVEERVAKEFPQERAAPKIAGAIRRIVSQTKHSEIA